MSECEDRHGRSLDSPPYEGTLRERQLWCRVDHHALLAAQARELAEARAEVVKLKALLDHLSDPEKHDKTYCFSQRQARRALQMNPSGGPK